MVRPEPYSLTSRGLLYYYAFPCFEDTHSVHLDVALCMSSR